MSSREVIEAYWENKDTVSLIDKNLRKLETAFVLGHLEPDDILADFGCGDGESTVEYAKKVKSCLAFEQSNHLLTNAKTRFTEANLSNVEAIRGSVTDLSEFENRFTKACTQRVVINFMTWEEQQQIITNVWKTLKPGGTYFMIENTFEGFGEMNDLRTEVGLPKIPLHDWHNHFLYHDQLMEFIEDKFTLEGTHNVNLYYLLTRVFTNMFANFEGYGINAQKDDIFNVADKAAREIYEKFNHRLKFDVKTGDSFGPIQGFVLKKK